jgi:hypothetical protein
MGSLSLDTMIHPQYRNKGLFTLLAKNLYMSLPSQQIGLTFGFPNKNSYRGFIEKLSWDDMSKDILIFARLLTIDSILSKIIKNFPMRAILSPLLSLLLKIYNKLFDHTYHKDIVCKTVNDFDESINSLWEKASQNIKTGVVRNMSYLRWRYIKNPKNHYKIYSAYKNNKLKGCIVLGCGEKSGLKIGFIAELITDPQCTEVASVLLKKANRYYKSINVDIVSIISLRSNPLLNNIKKSGFIKVPKILYSDDFHYCFIRHTIDSENDIVSNPTKWYISWGDHDVV